jgi:hypothetical protein
MFDTDALPFTIDLWAGDELSIVEEVARASSLTIARVAFDAAAVVYPRRMLTLRGPGVCETHAGTPCPAAREFPRPGSGGMNGGARRSRKDFRDVA